MGSLWSSWGAPIRPVVKSVRGDASVLVLEGLVERPDVAAAEGQRAFPFDQLDEEGVPLMRRSGEDLEHLPPSVAVSEDVQVAQHLDRDGQLPEPGRQRLVVAGGRDEELSAVL